MATVDDAPELASVKDKFDIEDHGKEWHLFCKVCGKGYALKKGVHHIGNSLALLNHAAGCEE